MGMNQEQISLINTLTDHFINTKQNNEFVDRTRTKHDGKEWVNGWLNKEVSRKVFDNVRTHPDVIRFTYMNTSPEEKRAVEQHIRNIVEGKVGAMIGQ